MAATSQTVYFEEFLARKFLNFERISLKYKHYVGKIGIEFIISPKCHIYASVNWVIISSGNGLSPVRRQAITWTSADILLIRAL